MNNILKYTKIYLPLIITVSIIVCLQVINLLYITILWTPIFFSHFSVKKNNFIIFYQSLLFAVTFFFMTIFFRVFFFEILTVPTESMKNTIIPGEKILINKIGFPLNGKLRKRNIPWLNALINENEKSQTINIVNNIFFDSRKEEFLRNKIIVFKPEKSKSRMVKRCVGIPGDTLYYKNSSLLINSKKIIDTILFIAKIKYSQNSDLEEITKNNVDYEILYHNPSINELIISFNNIQILKNISLENVEILKPLFPKIQSLSTDIIIIPAKKYFVIGDNASISRDSRDIGLISEGEILGLAENIILSKRFSCPMKKIK